MPLTKPNGKAHWIPLFEEPLQLPHADGYGFDQAGDLDRFMKGIGVDIPADERMRDGARGVRFAIRPKPKDGEAPAPWCPVDITMLIDTRPPNEQASAPPAVAAPVEIFEHPVAVDAAPLMFDDLSGESGRVLVCRPGVTGLLDDLLSSATDRSHAKPGLVLTWDDEQRVGTRLRWNTCPAMDDADAEENNAKSLARFFGGFDLFETDVANSVEGAAADPVALAITYKFSTFREDAAPGSGALRLNGNPQSQTSTLFVDLRDLSGVDRSTMLDLLDASSEHVKGQLRLVKASDPSCWLAFDLTAVVTMQGYRKLMLLCTDASDKGERTPFKNDDAVVLLFTRIPTRRPIRVQALPAAMARLDPPEIADFAKVKARYPSETRRLPPGGAQRAWYSPAESHVVWPERTLRRALSINVDETILTELIANGRPAYLEARLQIGKASYEVKQNSRGTAAALGRAGVDTMWTMGRLRALLQDLTWDTRTSDVLKHHEDNPEQFRDARVTITARGRNDALLAQAEWSIDLDPSLHPVLADAIDWVRYARMPPAEFMPLKVELSGFTKQLPASTLARCTGVVFELVQWPGEVAPGMFGFRSGSETQFQSPLRFRFPPDADADSKARSLQAAVERLVTRLPTSARTKLAADYTANRAAYEAVSLRLLCETRHAGEPAVLASFPVDVRSVFEEQSNYRRYEPVLESLPKVGASDAAAWLDETTTERDPFGWSILRTLGLGVGLRLYDAETREYLAPVDTLSRLREAMTRALAWYGDCFVGAPFVDVVTQAGATMRLASFDGGMPGLTPGDVAQLLDRDALALTQISLRPLADRWRRYAGDKASIDNPVAYLAVVFREPKKKGDRSAKISINLAPDGSDRIAVADVLDLTAGLAKAPSITLSNYSAAEKKGFAALNAALAGAGNRQSTLEIDVSRARDGDVVALVRAIVVEGDAAREFGGAWVDGGASREVVPIADPMAGGPAEPFARFGDMAAERYRALAGAHGAIKTANETLYAYLRRRFPNKVAEDQLLARIPGWTLRFLLHGPAFRPPRDVHFSLAEVTRPDPWRVGVQQDGTMEALLTHDDRKRRLKRYAVRPFGRYESFVDALRGVDPAAGPRLPQLAGGWSDRLAGRDDVQARFAGSWSRRFLDIVIPRTEPLAPPVLVDARRIEILPPGETDPKKARRVLEFLYKRHAEELLSEANATAEGALSFETMAVGFWREFPMQRWAWDLVPQIDTAVGFGALKPGPEPAGLIDSADRFGGLAAHPGGRYTDGWRGVIALRTEALPFFFRIHAVAFAAAGVVVSEPVVATVEEGHYDLNLPWKQALFEEVTPVPRWSVLRRDDDDPGVHVTFHLPLVRFVDGMPVDTRPIWLSPNAIPEVFALPDPAARYEIRLVKSDETGLSSVSAELDVMGEQGGEPSVEGSSDPLRSGYRVNVVGPRFAAGSAPRTYPDRRTDHGVWWSAAVSARLGQREAPAEERFAPRVEPVEVGGAKQHPLTLIELHPEAFAADAVWQGLAPQTTATVIVTPVSAADATAFARFKADVVVWRDTYAPYTARPAGKAILDFLQAWIDSDGIVPPPIALTVSGFTWGLPRLPAGRPAAVRFAAGAIGDWGMPVHVGIAERQALRQLQTSRTAGGYDQAAFAADVCQPVRAEMRRLSVLRKDGEPGNRFRDFPPFTTLLPGDLAAAALQLGLAADADAVRLLPACADVIVRVTIDADPQAHTAGVVALIAAVEAAPFTALALADLGPLEDGGSSALVHLPCKALLEPEVSQALAALSATDPVGWRAVSLLLRMPPTDEEREAILKAIATAVTEAADREPLAAFADRAMAAQIFGLGRMPGLKVFRGRADPAEDMIVRSDGGAQPWP